MKYTIGIDLGGTNIAAGLVDENYRIVTVKSVKTRHERGYEAVCRDMAQLCADIAAEADGEIASVGVGAPGTINSGEGIIIYANNLQFRGVNIRQEINKVFERPVFVENDADCAALGESAAGASKGLDNSVMITLGTGIGSGFILNGAIYKGSFAGTGEFGHTVIHTGGEQCTCGRRGCLEAYASATALIRDTKRAANEHPNSLIWELAGGNIENIEAKTAFDAADAGDYAGKLVTERYVSYLAEGLANLVNIFQPAAIVIGGGIGGRGESLLAPLRERTEPLCYGGVLRSEIVAARLGNNAGIIGAAALSNDYKIV